MEMCRACLSTKEKLVPLDGNFITSYNLLTNLNISNLDNMPQYTCENCLEEVHNFIIFRDKSIASEMMLRDLILMNVKPEKRDNNKISLDDEEVVIVIKHEIKEEENEDLFILESPFEYEDDNSLLVEINKKELANVKPKASGNVSKIKKNPNMPQKIQTDNCLHCGICPETFEVRNELNNHLENHKAHRQCSICFEIFANWYQLLPHRLTHVPEKQKKCHICMKRFCEPAYLEYHYVKVHFGGTPKLPCKFCSKTFENPRKLKNHRWSVHQGLKYFCDICKKGFSVKTSLRSHLRKHSEERAFACDLCDYTSRQHCGLKEHKIRKHSPFKVNCKTCQRVFESQEILDKHKCKQLSYVVCPICGVRKLSKSLNKHLEQHSDVSKYECKRCPAKFKTQGGLKAHLDRHDGNRTKECEFCHAKFYTGSVLIKHRRTHTGEKPYVCKICDKAFTGNYNLKVHMRVHGEYIINKKDKIADNKTNAKVRSPSIKNFVQ